MEGLLLLFVVIAAACWYDLSRRCGTLESRMGQVEHLADRLDGKVFALQQGHETRASAAPTAPPPLPRQAPASLPLSPAVAPSSSEPRQAWVPEVPDPARPGLAGGGAAPLSLPPVPAMVTPMTTVPSPGPTAVPPCAPPSQPATATASTAAPYSEKANRNEMEFAGYYLNVAGILFLILGVGLLLRTACHVAGSGVVQTLGGLVAGLVLLVTGDRCYRQDMKSYAHPLIAGGLCVLLLTNCAAHFYFHFIDRLTLFASVAATVAAAGFAVFRYDSRLIGNFMLAALYLGPLFLDFSLKQAGVVFAYLVAIHVGTALVAWHKKWDWFLLVSFLGTYTLFFVYFRAERPLLALVFMTVVYLLFLVSNNLLHFKRRDQSPYNLTLSFVNPMVYAVISYPFLLGLANLWALALYLGLACVHLAISHEARRRGGEDPALAGLALNNLVLGLLFLTAAVSFVTYFSQETACFAIVTAAWFAEAFALFGLALRTARCDPFRVVLRRFSWFSLLLASAQVFCVIPTMDTTSVAATLHRLAINLASLGAFIAYASWLHRCRATLGSEERLAMRSSAVLGLGLLATLLTGGGWWSLQVVAFSALAVLMLVVAVRARESFEFLAVGAALLALGTVAVTLLLDASVAVISMMAGAQVFLAVTAWRLLHARAGSDNWEGEWETYPCWLACALLFKLAFCAPPPLGPLAAVSALAILAWYLSLKQRSFLGAFSGVAVLATLYAVTNTLMMDAPPALVGVGCLVQVALCLGLSSLLRAHEPILDAWEIATPPWLHGLACLLLFRAALVLSVGVQGTLLWVLICLAMLRGLRGLPTGTLQEDMVRVAFFVTFLKSVIFDGNFVSTGAGWQIAQASSMGVGQFIAIAGLTSGFFLAARQVWARPELRNFLLILGLVVFAFQSAAVLYNFYGVLDTFQIILSAFWAASSFFCVAFGIHRETRIFRLFGLLLLVSTVLKICVVDIWVLNAYSQTTTFLIMGGLLMAISFLYQSHRHHLDGADPSHPGPLHRLVEAPVHP